MDVNEGGKRMTYSIGEVITGLREAKRWSMGTLGAYSGLTTGAISQIESGRTKIPSAGTIGRLATALGVEPNYLYEQAGWYKPRHNSALPPEVLKLAQVIDSYPNGPARKQATQMIIDIAIILQTLREQMEDQPDLAIAANHEQGVVV